MYYVRTDQRQQHGCGPTSQPLGLVNHTSLLRTTLHSQHNKSNRLKLWVAVAFNGCSMGLPGATAVAFKIQAYTPLLPCTLLAAVAHILI